MNSDTPFVEYLIIGTHTSVGLILIILWSFNIPISSLSSIDPAQLVVGLPFIYLIGMLFDDLAHRPLEPIRRRLRDKIYDPNICRDELLAFASENLYSAYEARVRRVRIIGASIFNWPLLGGATLLHIGFYDSLRTPVVLGLTIGLLIISAFTWHNLYRRAYEFRKKACEIILKDRAEVRNAKQPVVAEEFEGKAHPVISSIENPLPSSAHTEISTNG